jgi:cytochrome c553
MKKVTGLLAALSLVSSLISLNAFASNSIEQGKIAVEKLGCASCHGPDYNTPIDPTYPKIAGQHKDYLVHSLKAYQRGANGLNGRGNAIMSAQVKALSNKDIENIAAYLNSLQGGLVVRR